MFGQQGTCLFASASEDSDGRAAVSASVVKRNVMARMATLCLSLRFGAVYSFVIPTLKVFKIVDAVDWGILLRERVERKG
jgi:hypothetical protein